MKDIAVSSYFLPIISAERELIGNNKLFLIFSYLSREARTYIGGNKEKRINKWKIYGLGCNFPQYRHRFYDRQCSAIRLSPAGQYD